MISRDSTGSPVLRARTAGGEFTDLSRKGPITQRALSLTADCDFSGTSDAPSG